MNYVLQLIRIQITVCLIILLSACSGGGSSSDSGIVFDNDNDGIADNIDPDDDNDTIPDVDDVDDDNNGLIEIRSLADLDDIRNHLDGSMQYGSDNGCLDGDCIGFELTQNLDFDTNNDGIMDAEDTYYNYDGGNGNGWLPLGSSGAPFIAEFDGNDFEIRNLFINRPNSNANGLFGQVLSAALRNIGLNGELMSLTGSYPVGGLVGFVETSDVSNCYATGTVTSPAYDVGGLVGVLYNESTISNSYATGSVTGESSVGGLVGYLESSTVTNSYASGDVTITGGGNIGGLVGASYVATITDSEASGTVTGSLNSYGLGGLVGYAFDTTITRSTARGAVTSDIYSFYVGGLVGDALETTITDSNASGNVASEKSSKIGGLVGALTDSTVTNSNASGDVTGTSNVGVLVGFEQTSSISSNSEGTGLVTIIPDDMK
jgi:hypothetical protein